MPPVPLIVGSQKLSPALKVALTSALFAGGGSRRRLVRGLRATAGAGLRVVPGDRPDGGSPRKSRPAAQGPGGTTLPETPGDGNRVALDARGHDRRGHAGRPVAHVLHERR